MAPEQEPEEGTGVTYYICPEHRKAWQSEKQFKGHWQFQHPGQPRPSDEVILMNEVPEGYELAALKGKRVSPPPPEDVPEEEVPEPKGKRPLPHRPKEATPVYGASHGPHQILEQILREHPGLPEAAVKEVMTWTKYKDFLHPNEVSWLLQQMSEVPKGAPVLVQTKYALALANAQATNAGGALTPGAFGGPSPGGVSLGFPWGGGGVIGSQGLNLGGPQQPAPESPATLELRQQMATMSQDMANLISHMNEKEREAAEEKRDAQHKAELQALQDGQAKDLARVEAANKEAIERLEKAQKEAIEGLRELLKGKGETQGGEDLRKDIDSLRNQLRETEARGFQEQVAALKDRLAASEKREPPADPSELGVIRDIGKEVVAAAREAGTGVRDLALGTQKGALLPRDLNPSERAAKGKELLARAGQDAEALANMDKFFAKG